MFKREYLVYIFIIVAVTALVYCDSFNNSFVYDDYSFLVDNPAVRSLDIRSVLKNFTDWRAASADDKLSKDVWRPLVTTSFAIDYSLWKLDSRFYHIENTLLHAACAVLVFVMTVLILENGFAAFIAALIFAVHPVQTEAVAWVSGRGNVLFLCFFLAAFISHVVNRKGKGAAFNYCSILIFFALSLLSKEMAIVLPLVCILYDACFYRKAGLRPYVSYYLPLFLIAACYVLTRLSVLGVIAQKSGWWGGSIFSNLILTVKAVAEYLRLLVFPVNLRVEYAGDIRAVAWDRDALAAMLAILFVGALYAVFRRRRDVSFYILWFFVTLIPVYNIVPFKAVMAERFLYLPMIGFASLVGILSSELAEKAPGKGLARPLLGLMLAAMIVSYGALSIFRNMEWRSEVSFYMKEAVRSPQNPKAHYNFACACAKEAARNPDNREFAMAYYTIAIGEFQKTVSLKPDSPAVYLGLANAFNAVGMHDRAIVNFRKALVFGEHSDIYNNLGVAYLLKNRYDEAEAAFRRALAIDASHINAAINLGNVYAAKHEYPKARKAWLRAMRLGGPEPLLPEKIKGLEGKGDQRVQP